MKTRFIKSIVATAKDSKTAMPWERGARREAFIAMRKSPKPVLRRA